MKHSMKRCSAMLLALAMLTGLIGVVPAQATTAAVTIDVSEYFGKSHEVNGVKEATTAVKEALAYAATLPKETQKIISFPKREYHFYADYAPVRELYVSNTLGTGSSSYHNKYIGILVEDMENVTIDGGGSSFIFHGNITTFAAIRSKNVVFTNYDFDHASPSVVDVTVESKVPGENAVIAYIPPAYTYTISGNSLTWKGEASPVTGQPYWQGNNSLAHQQGLDTLEGKKNGGGQSALFNGVTKLEDLGGGRVKITYSGSTPKVGYCFQMRNTTRVTPGVFIWESQNVTLKDIGAHFLHGFGLVAQLSKDVTIDNVDFRAKPGTGRTSASFADFLQMSSVGGKVTIKNCDFYDPQDDPINIHGTFLTVYSVSSDKKTFGLQYRHNETGGFPQYYVGDTVDFSTKGTMVPVADSTRTVTAVNNFPGGDKNKIEITLDRPVEGIVGNNDSHVVENVTYTPEVEIINNRFVETPTRGILVTTRKPILIENNYFDAMGMASIYISCDAQSWYESGHTEDVIIRNNVFDRLTKSAILVRPTGNNDSNFQLHKKILVEDNVFNIVSQNGADGEGNLNRVVNAKSVENLTIKNNTVNRADPNVSLALTADSQTLAVNGTQPTNLAKSGSSISEPLYRFENCKNVTVEGNTYDSGLNHGSELTAGTSAANVTVTNDAVTVGDNNQKPAVDKVSYFSANPAVATVDANGVVRGVSTGTAEIFAYTVSGARVFESNRVTFTVSPASGGGEPAPTAITVSALQDKIDVAATLQFTAVTTPADQAVTWSVRGAATGTATDVATIDASTGLLTAAKPGVVEVLATSATDGTVYGSKLLTVRVPDGGKSAAWTIDREAPGKWAVNEDGTLTILAQKGGDWNTGKAAKNLFLTDAPDGNFSFTVELKNKTSGKTSWDEAGLIVFKDADNYVALERKNAGGSAKLAVATEVAAVADEDEPNRPNDIANAAISFKLERNGDTYTGYYRADSTAEWTKIRDVTNTALGDNFKIGVVAANAEDITVDTSFTFADFKIGSTPVPFLSTNHDPVASAPAITTADTTLTLGYNFTDEDSGDTQGNSLFAWYAADSENGIYRRIADSNSATLAVTPALSGKYIKAAVVPVDQGGRTGAPVYASAVHAPVVAGDQTDATLRTLEISGVALSPAFASGVTSYSAMLPASAGDLTVTATPSQPDATVVVTQTDDKVSVAVTAPNDTDTKTYTVSLARAKDSNSALETLDLTGAATLSLDGSTRFYQLLVDADVETLQLDAAAASAGARLEVRYNYEILNDYDSAEGSYTLALVGGLNFVEVRTLAEDGVSTRIYRVAIMKTPSSEAGLASLSVNGASVPGFDSGKDTYHLDVQAGPVTFAAVAKSEKAKVEYFLNGVAAASPAELSDHLTTLTVKVTAENTSTVHTYTVYLVIPATNSTDLISFSTGNVALTPAFNQAVTAYTANVSQQTLPLSVLAVEGKALITAETQRNLFRGLGKLDAAIPLADGVNTVTVTITSPDGTATKTYTLDVTKTNSVYLSDLEWVSGVSGDGDGIPRRDSAWEGHPMSVTNADGSEANFAKGIGTHANSTIIYNLAGKGYETFTAKIGASYSQKGLSQDYTNVVFTVICDGVTKHTSSPMKKNTPYVDLSIDVRGVNELKLLVTQSPNQYNAHGNWADAKLTLPAETPADQYAVNVTEAEHASLWTERKQAAAGETVTIHVDDIADGYQFTSLTVKAADETDVATTAVEAGKVYTFTMPAQAVTVEAQFEEISAAVKTVTAVDVVSNISVPYGTAENALGLPATVGVTFSDATTGTIGVTWASTPAYNATTPGAYIFTGTLATDPGYNTNGKTATCTVTVQEQVISNIVSVAAIENVNVAYGTAESAVIAQLPTKVTATLDNNATVELAVGAWSGTGYDANTAGSYEFTGTLTITDGITNTDSVTAEVTVVVGAQNAVKPVTADPAPGTYIEAKSVVLASATEGAVIYYTTDGTEPSKASTPYTAPISVEETTTIKAIATKAGMADSAVSAFTYTINLPPVLVPVTGVTLDRTSATLYSNRAGTVTLTATVNPGNATNKAVTWSSSDETVATVTNGGVVSAAGNKNGTAVITVTTVEGSKTASCTITVETYTEPSYNPPSNTTTETTKNPDGSTTKTVTNKTTGTVTETTTKPNGDKSVVETKKDGTVTEKVTNKDGYQSETVTKSDGSFTSTVKDAKGVKTETTATAAGETTAKVTLPKDVESAKVTVPTKEPKPGTVAVIVKADGTQEIVKTSVTTETGVSFVTTENVTVKLVDNSKSFADVSANNWAHDAIQFAASRELFQGTGKDGFSPAGDMTRGMLVTVLARLDGQDTTGGETWYSKAMEWAKEQDITDGTSPESSITRESLAVMLYRFAGQPKAEKTEKTFTDLESVSTWAADAMSWAVSAGILNGADGKLNPGDTATRAEVATMLQRYVAEMQK